MYQQARAFVLREAMRVPCKWGVLQSNVGTAYSCIHIIVQSSNVSVVWETDGDRHARPEHRGTPPPPFPGSFKSQALYSSFSITVGKNRYCGTCSCLSRNKNRQVRHIDKNIQYLVRNMNESSRNNAEAKATGHHMWKLPLKVTRQHPRPGIFLWKREPAHQRRSNRPTRPTWLCDISICY